MKNPAAAALAVQHDQVAMLTHQLLQSAKTSDATLCSSIAARIAEKMDQLMLAYGPLLRRSNNIETLRQVARLHEHVLIKLELIIDFCEDREMVVALSAAVMAILDTWPPVLH